VLRLAPSGDRASRQAAGLFASPAPRRTRIPIPDAGHLIHWSVLETTLRRVLAFLETVCVAINRSAKIAVRIGSSVRFQPGWSSPPLPRWRVAIWTIWLVAYQGGGSYNDPGADTPTGRRGTRCLFLRRWNAINARLPASIFSENPIA
jgi:hypothetical protein